MEEDVGKPGMPRPSVFSLIRSHKCFLFLGSWNLTVSYRLKSSAGKLNCHPSRSLGVFFSKISVLSLVVYVVLFLIVNCNRRWHKFDVIGENWWALSSLCQIKLSKEAPFWLIPLLGQIIVWVLQGHAVVSSRVLISCSGSERQRTCIWVCRPLPVANPPLRCPSVLWEGSGGALAGSERT